MRFERSKEWWLARSRAEPEVPIGAGVAASDTPADNGQPAVAGAEVAAPAARFGEFVHLLRRQRGLSVEQFADAVNIDLSEAQTIEEDVFYCPEARTVYYMAKAFNLPQGGLNELAGITVANDHTAIEGQQRYAARSQSRSALSSVELALLNAIVAALDQQASDSSR